MKQPNNIKAKASKIYKIILVITLILGLLSSIFGVTVIALNSKKVPTATQTVQPGNNTNGGNSTTASTQPTQGRDDIKNEISLNENVTVLTETESKKINSAIRGVETTQSYYGNQLVLTLEGEDFGKLNQLGNDDIFYLHGDETTPFGGDRILRVESISSYNGKTTLKTSEPYFEDVFTDMSVCSADLLTEDNLAYAYYAEGVSSYFGDAETDIKDVSETQELSEDDFSDMNPVADDLTVDTMANDYSTAGGDLILEIDYDFNKDDDDDDEDDDDDDDDDEDDDDDDDDDKDIEDVIDTSFGIKGSVGIKDLTAHMVCDMPSVTTFEELYFGLSGTMFLDIDLYGKISASAEMEATKKDTLLFSFEGLNEKRFPIAVFKFNGTTPVYITNAAFEKGKESLVPSLYVIFYADWEGKISLELNGGIEFNHSFNNGLSIFKNGEANLMLESYPYEKAYSVESQDGFAWDANLKLEASTDLTFMGCSVLFYVAGVNLAEVSAIRFGVEAECNLSISANSKTGISLLEDDDTEMYIRAYLKIIEVKVKLKADGKSFLKKLSIDISFEFALLDITLFEHGDMPDKYRPKVPISSVPVPTEFASVISLVFDVSGSMDSTIDSGQTKLAAAQEAAKTIVTSTQNWAANYTDNYGLGVIMFSDNAELVAVPHIDYDYISECIDTIGDGGGTSIHSGIDAGISQLEAPVSPNKVIILMTDGQDSNDTETLASAQKAADAGIKIYTIGFGDDVDEDILMQIAETTGGEYRFANTENIMGIMGSFLYAQQASSADILTDFEGTVGEGETSDASSFTVADESGDLIVSTAWPGSFLDTILIDPNGRVVDENYPNATTDETKIPSTITVKNPIKGKWSVKVKGVETSYEQEPYYTIVAFKKTEPISNTPKMTTLETVSSYCIAIGTFTALTSAMLLVCTKKKKED